MQNRMDQLRHAAPLLGLALQPAPPGVGEGVILCPSIIVAFTPLIEERFTVFQAVQRRVQRALLNDELLA